MRHVINFQPACMIKYFSQILLNLRVTQEFWILTDGHTSIPSTITNTSRLRFFDQDSKIRFYLDSETRLSSTNQNRTWEKNKI